MYPTWGEGFGFIPLQGLASGMPVISTYDWSHYVDYMGPLKLKSKLTDETISVPFFRHLSKETYLEKMYSET